MSSEIEVLAMSWRAEQKKDQTKLKEFLDPYADDTNIAERRCEENGNC